MNKKFMWISLAVLSLAAVLFLMMLFIDFQKSYDIDILVSDRNRKTVSIGDVYYLSDVEVSPIEDSVTITAGQDVGDSMIVLIPVQHKQEQTYKPTYITPGLPVKIEAEHGAWFKIGVAGSPEADKTVTVSVSGVDLRIP